MVKIYIKLYSAFRIDGDDFAPMKNDTIRRFLFSPDGRHSIVVNSLRDGTLLITNESDVEFEISLSRERKKLAMLKYRPDFPALLVNTNWRLGKDGIENREIHQNPDLNISKAMNIDFMRTNSNSFGRVDLKLEESGFAC